MSMDPLVAQHWFEATPAAPGVTRIEEPHAHELLRANIWHVEGAERDLVIDAGLGVASLRVEVPKLFAHDPILVLSHAHLDHVGSAHEFADRRMHAASVVDECMPATLYGPELAPQLGIDPADMPELLLDRVPAGFDPRAYRIPPAPATRCLADGDAIDIGDRSLRVLHLPGHTPGSICLFDEASGALFSGDVIYDDLLLDELHESSIADYVRSMRRLRDLPVRTVYPGHGAPFDAERMRAIIDAYLLRREG